MEHELGTRRCEFCGRRLAPAEAPPAPGGGTRHGAGGLLGTILVLGLVIGALAFMGKRAGEPSPPPGPPPAVLAGKRLAAAACEDHISRSVRAPFRVVGFRSSLVAEEEGGQVVSGTVDLQSLAGELQRKRYWCRLHPDGQAGVAVEDGRVY